MSENKNLTETNAAELTRQMCPGDVSGVLNWRWRLGGRRVPRLWLREGPSFCLVLRGHRQPPFGGPRPFFEGPLFWVGFNGKPKGKPPLCGVFPKKDSHM